MRILIKTSPNDKIVPFDYQNKLEGVIHKWLGKNEIHDTISLYSYSWLKNGIISNDGMNYPNGSEFFISFNDNKYISDIIKSLLNSESDMGTMFNGMRVIKIEILNEPDFNKESRFNFSSPIFIKRNIGDKYHKHYTFNDNESNDLMTETTAHKMKEAGMKEDNTFSIKFDTSYKNKKIKTVNYRNIKCKVNFCPVIITGNSETKRFIWNTGVGNSTGIGFGSITL